MSMSGPSHGESVCLSLGEGPRHCQSLVDLCQTPMALLTPPDQIFLTARQGSSPSCLQVWGIVTWALHCLSRASLHSQDNTSYPQGPRSWLNSHSLLIQQPHPNTLQGQPTYELTSADCDLGLQVSFIKIIKWSLCVCGHREPQVSLLL